MRNVLLHRGFTNTNYSAPHWEYPHEVLCDAYGFGKYETVWTFPNADNTVDRERFIRNVLTLPRNSILYINHESGKYAWSNTGDIRTVNSEYLLEHKWLMFMVRMRRPDIVFGDFNFVPYVGYFQTDDYLGFIREANRVRYEAGNGGHFLIPHLYQRAALPIVKDGQKIGERPVSLDEELWSFGQCLTAAREQWPYMKIIPAICVQYNHRVCEVVWDRMSKEQLAFRWTPEEVEKCRLPKQRLYALLQLLTAHGIDTIMVWSAGMVPVTIVQENLELLREWKNQ